MHTRCPNSVQIRLSLITELPLPFQIGRADRRILAAADAELHAVFHQHPVIPDGAHMLQVDHIAAAHLQKTILGQNGRQLLQLAC